MELPRLDMPVPPRFTLSAEAQHVLRLASSLRTGPRLGHPDSRAVEGVVEEVLRLVSSIEIDSERDRALLALWAAQRMARRDIDRQAELFKGLLDGSLTFEIRAFRLIPPAVGLATYGILEGLRRRLRDGALALAVVIFSMLDVTAMVTMGESILFADDELASVSRLAEELPRSANVVWVLDGGPSQG